MVSTCSQLTFRRGKCLQLCRWCRTYQLKSLEKELWPPAEEFQFQHNSNTICPIYFRLVNEDVKNNDLLQRSLFRNILATNGKCYPVILMHLISLNMCTNNVFSQHFFLYYSNLNKVGLTLKCFTLNFLYNKNIFHKNWHEVNMVILYIYSKIL